jgi:hypothetical protein
MAVTIELLKITQFNFCSPETFFLGRDLTPQEDCQMEALNRPILRAIWQQFVSVVYKRICEFIVTVNVHFRADFSNTFPNTKEKRR